MNEVAFRNHTLTTIFVHYKDLLGFIYRIVSQENQSEGSIALPEPREGVIHILPAQISSEEAALLEREDVIQAYGHPMPHSHWGTVDAAFWQRPDHHNW